MGTDLLSQLKDIHYPAPISIRPLAMGWYWVMVLLIGILLLVVYLWLKMLKKRRLKKIVLKRLDELQAKQEFKPDIAEELSMLLKRSALAIYPRHEVAGLYGEQWLAFLDKTAMSTEFTNGPGRLLIVLPYQGQSHSLPDSLFHLIKNWVKKNL